MSKKRDIDIQIVPSVSDHIEPIAGRMRQADVDEIWAAGRKTPHEALEYSLKHSGMARTAMINGVPEVMFGVGDVNLLIGVGAPWLLGTEAVEKNYVAFLRGSIEWRNQLSSRYPILRNFVDTRNKAAVRWLKWLGFDFSEPMELNGHMFYLFELRSKDV